MAGNIINSGNILTIFKKEMRSYFNSATAYVLIVFFLAILGWFYVNSIFLENISSMRSMFEVIPWIFLFVIPAITMRLISEEKKSGTLELLTTKPISDTDIILGKFLAAWGMVGITLIPTLLYYITVSSVGQLDHGVVIGAYLGILLMSAVYISLGLLASSLSDNQIIAFIAGLAFILVFFLFDKILFFIPQWSVGFVEFLGVDYHYLNIAKGVIDSRDIIYFISLTGFVLYLTVVSLDRRKW